MPDKGHVAEDLSRWHFEVEPDLLRVYRVLSDHEDDPQEPIKLVEVNMAAVGTDGLEAFGFAPTRDVPHSTLITEITPDDLQELRTRGAIPSTPAVCVVRYTHTSYRTQRELGVSDPYHHD